LNGIRVMPAAAPSGPPADALILVGCGKMGSAMLRGWLKSGAATRFFIVEPAGAPEGLADAAGTFWHREPDTLPAELEPDAVVFALKPQVIDGALPVYRRWVQPQTLFVSIAAGKTMAGIFRHLGRAALVRAMPNTPAAIGRGITVACAGPQVSAEQRQFCEKLLAAIGESAWVADERLMDAVTAVSGSGPAYVFLLIEALARAGEAAGLPADLALYLARSTVAGAGELARLSPEPPARLRADVTSPGGTTEAALAVLMEREGLGHLIERAVAAATARSRQLAS
jgi:pyrroline-5-carboxylate reductase